MIPGFGGSTDQRLQIPLVRGANQQPVVRAVSEYQVASTDAVLQKASDLIQQNRIELRVDLLLQDRDKSRVISKRADAVEIVV